MSLLDLEKNPDKPKKTSKLFGFLDKIKKQLHKNTTEISQNQPPKPQIEIQRDWDMEYEHIFDDWQWLITIKQSDTGQELWKLKYKLRHDSIEINIIISYRAWTWTKLVQKLVEVSRLKWKNGVLTAVATPFMISDKPSHRRENTNLRFYYKMWFRAKDEKIHQEIMKYLDNWEEIPISLNINTELTYDPN